MADIGYGRVAHASGARIHAIVTFLEGVGERVGGGLRQLELRLLCVQRLQRLYAPNEPARVGGGRDGDVHAVGAARRGIVLVDHRLHPPLRIAAGAAQILPGVVDFVLIERELRLSEVETVGE